LENPYPSAAIQTQFMAKASPMAAGMVAFKNAQIHVPTALLVFLLALVLVGHAGLWAFGN
jgi:hypothetical protein